jgi:hypothetical protein
MSTSKPEYDSGFSSLNFINLTHTKVPSNTFDDLWDWRLNKGDLLGLNNTKKQLIDFTMKRSVVAPTPVISSLKPVKEEAQNEVGKESGSEEEDSDVEMKQIGVLSKMADLDTAGILKKINKDRKKHLEGINPGALELKVRSKEKKARALKKEHLEVLTLDVTRKSSFSISDEEFDSPTLKHSQRKSKKQKEESLGISKLQNFQNLKYDEDFQYIGDVKIEEEPFEKPKLTLPSAINPKTITPSKDQKTVQIDIPKETKKSPEQKYKEDEKTEKSEAASKDNDKKEKPSDKEPTPTKKKPNEDKKNEETDIETKKKKKKKNKEKRGDAIDLTKAYYEREENIANYYRSKLKYEFLQIDAHFPYNRIPNSAFSSIPDVVPHFSQGKKELSQEQQIEKQANQKLPLQYNFAALNNAKKAKKKPKKKTQMKTKGSAENNKSNLTAISSGKSTDGNSTDSEIDNFEEDFETVTLESTRGSTLKVERQKFFKTMEKFIRNKPFPLGESENRSKILKSMTAGALTSNTIFRAQSQNQVEPSSPSIKSKVSRPISGATKPSSLDRNAEEKVLIEQFAKDQIEVEKVYREFQQQHEHHDFKMLYLCIRATDSEHKGINKFNWSGNQIMAPHQFTFSQTDKTIDSLNFQRLDIWKKGWEGCIYTVRRYAREFVNSGPINFFLLSCVFLNTIILALDGLTPDSWTEFFNNLNLAFTAIFAAEMALKLFGLGLRLYVKDFFNVFDAFVVAISMVELVINSLGNGGNGGATSGLKAVRIFRIFRVLRVTRLLRSLKFMKVIIDVLKSTFEQFMYIALLMFLFVFIFTLLGTQIFGGGFKFDVYDYAPVRYNFDSFSSAFFTVFTVLTLENWNAVLINCLRSETNAILSVVYLISWIFIGNYIFINLFLSILLEGFENSQALHELEELENESRELARVHKRLVHQAEEKKKKEEQENEEAYKKVQIITQPEKFADEEIIKKNQACYLVVRNDDEDNDSLSDHCDLSKYLEKGLSSHKPKIDPYSGVTCFKSFFYFQKTHPVRLFCARIVSHPK